MIFNYYYKSKGFFFLNITVQRSQIQIRIIFSTWLRNTDEILAAT